jgi:hypothetical protein
MKKTIFILTLLAISLTACASPVAQPPTTEPVPVEGKIRAPSFESQTYINETVGFALEYPAQWTVNETMTGDRGTQSVLLSSPEIADLEILPSGTTRVAVNVNQWDPKNDLAAFVEARKMAWDSSGFAIVEEEPLTLDLGLAAVRFNVQTPDGIPVEFLFAAIHDQYVTISGEGDLALVKEIMQYLRPIGN